MVCSQLRRVGTGTLISDRDALAEAGIQAVHCIGDAMSPRPLAEVTFESHRVASEFESPEPAIALPYKREPLRLVLEGALSTCRTDLGDETPGIRQLESHNLSQRGSFQSASPHIDADAGSLPRTPR